MTERVRVVVQESRRLLREGLAGLLEAQGDIDVVAVIAHAGEVPASDSVVDVVLLGMGKPPDRWPHARVVRFSGRDTAASLIEAVRLTSPRVEPSRAVADAAGLSPLLTPRQVEVVRGLAAGQSTTEIGAGLAITSKSVDNHKQQIFARLGARNSAHAIVLAREAGLLGPRDDDGFGR
jgi:DNA-binding NarL/FixJ family response regulator